MMNSFTVMVLINWNKIHINVTCHAKTRPSANFIILRKTITNTKHKRSMDFEFFIYYESTMTNLHGDTFEIFR